jgi:hypothetical protein
VAGVVVAVSAVPAARAVVHLRPGLPAVRAATGLGHLRVQDGNDGCLTYFSGEISDITISQGG